MYRSKAGAANHYCCAVEPQVVYQNRTRVSSYNVTQTLSVVIGYEPCGENLPNPYTTPTTRKPSLFESLFGTTRPTFTIPTNIPTCVNKPIYETSEQYNFNFK